jgi:spore germination protein
MGGSSMFNRSDDKITSSQASIFLSNTVLGAGILTLPRSVTETVRTPDSWIAILLGGFIVMLVVVIMVKLSRQFPNKTVYQYSRSIIGLVPAGFLCTLLILYYVTIASFEIRTLAEVTLYYLLEGTPIWAILIPFIWTGSYLVIGGINAISRVFQIIFPISILVLIISYLLSLQLFDLDNLRPILGEGIMPVIRGLKSTVLVYTGCEVILTLVAHMQHPQQAIKAMLWGISIPFCLYFLTVVMVIGGISVDSAVTSTWPTIDLIRSYEISGFFMERFEFPLMVIWSMQMFCNFSSFFYNASLGVSQLFYISIKPVIFAMMPVIFIASMIPKKINDVFDLGDAIGRMGIVLFFIVPVFLTLVWIIRKKVLHQNA